MDTCKWPLSNGEFLEFNVYGPNTQWNKVGGLYIFTQDCGAYWRALYVGKTDDFSSRLPSHERWDEAGRNGATHIHAKVVSQAANRDTWERQLIAHLQPQLNDQLKVDSALSKFLGL
jgi:hypothetical protein